MSHTAEYSTVIIIPQIDMRSDKANLETGPNFDILKRAMEIVISERGGIITNHIHNNEGEKIPCILAIKTDDFKRGIGIKINQKDEVSFDYDAFGGYEKLAKEIENEINQQYNTISTIQTLKAYGCDNVEIKEIGGDNLVKGVLSKIKSIEVFIPKKGNFKLDFSGFSDGICFEESDKLRRTFAGFGLELKEGVIHRKSPEEIKSEVDNKVSQKDKPEIII